MTNDPVEARVRALIGRTFGLEPNDLEGELKMGALPGWDSMGHMDLIFEIEQAFSVKLPTPRIAELIDLRTICKFLADAGDT